MKSKRLNKKLTLGKITVANLGHGEQGAVKGGYWKTEIMGGCTSWHPVCPTLPEAKCNTDISVCLCPASEDITCRCL
jgi:hypothetical protein